MCDTIRQLSWIAYRRNDRDAVVRFRERALSCVEAKQGPTNQATIVFMRELSDAYFPGFPLVDPRNRPEWITKADALFQRWLPIVQTALGSNDLEVARLLAMQAKVYAMRNEPDKAKDTRLRALAIAENQPNPAKPDSDRLDVEIGLLEALRYAHSIANLRTNGEYLAYQVRLVAAEEKRFGPTHPRTVRSREFLADMRARLPDLQPEMPVPGGRPVAPVPVRQAAAPAQNAETTGDARIVQAVARKTSKPVVWPTGMEPGNLYFVVNTFYEKHGAAPLMVAAMTPQEAVDRVRRAEEAYSGRSPGYRVITDGVCTGPAWGAVVVGNGRHSWGGGCGKTPAQAIEAAFAACRQNGPANCDTVSDNYLMRPVISLALSGSTSWSGTYCSLCLPSMNDRFGSFNAFTENAYLNANFINGMQDAISKLGKACDESRPCFYTSTTIKCFHETEESIRAEKCTERRLTPDGYNGPIRR